MKDGGAAGPVTAGLPDGSEVRNGTGSVLVAARMGGVEGDFPVRGERAGGGAGCSGSGCTSRSSRRCGSPGGAGEDVRGVP